MKKKIVFTGGSGRFGKVFKKIHINRNIFYPSSKQLNIRDLKHLSEVSLQTLKENKLISKSVTKVKVFGKYDLDKAINFSGVSLTKGALESIEKAGGKVS